MLYYKIAISGGQTWSNDGQTNANVFLYNLNVFFVFLGNFTKNCGKNTFFACISGNTRSLRILSDGQSLGKDGQTQRLEKYGKFCGFLVVFFELKKWREKRFLALTFERGLVKGWSNVVKRWTTN